MDIFGGYAKNPKVAYVEPDLMMYAFADEQVLPTGVNRIDAEQNTTAAVDVDIAIIDTGIDIDHPDLNVRGGIRFYTITTGAPWERGSFEDGNYDDDHGHGSHVAGTAAAIDNSIGVVGVAPGARVWGVKVLDASGSGYLSDIIAGINWVTENAETIEVANMSLGGTGKSNAYREAIQNSVAFGVVYVVAAGNNSKDVYGADGIFNTSDDTIPAAYPEVATISAMADSDGQPGGTGPSTSYGSDDSFASFSNYSASVIADNPVNSLGKAIDLLLPGVSIYSTYKNGGYATMSGTSMASPHAAGLAALYIAANDRAYNATGVYAIRQALIDGGVAQNSPQGLTTLNDPDGNPENLGWAGPLGSVTDIAITTVSAPSSVPQGNVVNVVVMVENAGNQDVTSNICVELMSDNATPSNESDDISIGTETITGGLGAGASALLSFSWDTTGAIPDDYTLTASHDFTGDDDPSNDSDITAVTITEGSTNTIYVANIEMDFDFKIAGKNKFVWAIAVVTIADTYGYPVEGATVYGHWTINGVPADSDSGITDSSYGEVSLESDAVKNPSGETTFMFTMDSVTKDGWDYVPGLNVEVEDSITVP